MSLLMVMSAAADVAEVLLSSVFRAASLAELENNRRDHVCYKWFHLTAAGAQLPEKS